MTRPVARPGARPGAHLALTIAIGTFGGWLATLLALPLAWMVGAMLATTAAALAGAPLAMPRHLRNGMIAVLGVMVGSGFSPEILARFGDWMASLLGVVLYILVGGFACHMYLRKVTRYDRITTYFSAMPGGLTEMILAGDELGGDARIISLIQTSRMLLVVLMLPFGFQLFLGYEPAAAAARGLQPLATLAPLDIAILAACAFLGYLGASVVKLPTAAITGPLLLSVGVHLAGWTSAKPPFELVAAAQVVMGSFVGVRFTGTALDLIGRTMAVAAGSSLTLLTATLACAFAMNALTGLPLAALVLAYSPGGLAEMSLIAIALALDAAFIASHHIVRILLIVLGAPALFRLLRRAGYSG